MSPIAVAMCSAGAAVLLVGALGARHEVARARGLDKVAALGRLCFAVPLAVFGALHLFGPQFVAAIVPPYMPGRAFWVYFVGCALIAAALSFATGVGVRWSGLLFGIMMFLFVAMVHLPGALRRPDERIIRTIVFREMAFGGGAWILAGLAVESRRSPLINVGRVFVTLAAVVFGVEHFLHPTVLPGVPLVKEMPAWVPGRMLIDYLTGAALLVMATSVVLNRRTRMVASGVGAWILLTLLAIYGPVLALALADPATPVQLEGVNYFADTMLFAGVVLALARAAPGGDAVAAS